MSTALITATSLGIAALVATLALGFTANSSTDVLQHTTLGIFATLLVLLSHSLTMFYLIGKGRAIRDAATEGGLSSTFFTTVSAARRPVFSCGTLAMVVTMATAIVGGGVDTGVLPSGFHATLGVLAVVTNLVTLVIGVRALSSSSRVAAEVDRLLGA